MIGITERAKSVLLDLRYSVEFPPRMVRFV